MCRVLVNTVYSIFSKPYRQTLAILLIGMVAIRVAARRGRKRGRGGTGLI